MQTIIQNKLSEMLDELLEKALKENINFKNGYNSDVLICECKDLSIYRNINSIKKTYNYKIYINLPLLVNIEDCNDSIELFYALELTEKQKGILEKIFSKYNELTKKTISNSLISMLDVLLQNSLKEKPIYSNQEQIGYEYLRIYYNFSKNEYDIEYAIYDKESDKKFIDYELLITDKQKELINKIFQKWSNTNDTNSK